MKRGRREPLRERHHWILSRTARCLTKRVVEKQALCQCRLGVPDGLPIGRAEIHAEREANLQKKVVGQDVREGTCNVGMVLDLAKARLDVIGMHDNVVVGV